MLNTHFKHATYNLILCCSFADMARRIIWVCVCLEIIAFLFIVSFCFRFGDVCCDNLWLFVAIFCFSIIIFRSNDVCYVFLSLLMVCVLWCPCVFICLCFYCSICVAMCVVWFSIFEFVGEVLSVYMFGDCLYVFHYEFALLCVLILAVVMCSPRRREGKLSNVYPI